jgi:hypothetical protein
MVIESSSASTSFDLMTRIDSLRTADSVFVLCGFMAFPGSELFMSYFELNYGKPSCCPSGENNRLSDFFRLSAHNNRSSMSDHAT